MPKVLVVDDTDSIRLLIRTNLEIADFEVDEAVDGRDALEQLAVDPLPDAVTVDMMMPRLDGVATVQAMRADPRTAGLAIIMVSTQNHPADIQRANDAGVDGYVVKPFDPDHLIDALNAAIAERA